MYQPTTAKKTMELAENMGDWKLPYMQLVDDFRRACLKQKQEIVAESVTSNNELWLSLLKAIVNQLCFDANLELPAWTTEEHWLKKPWFVSGFKSLHAIAIAESPLFFRRNNIFVTKDFLKRC